MYRSEELHAAYGKTISYVIFKEMEGAFQCCVFFVLAATVSEERLFCLIRDIGVFSTTLGYMILTNGVLLSVFMYVSVCVCVFCTGEHRYASLLGPTLP